jgi:Asp-tRNA(Asn)/Glu-tRNA(Gln) amidotransferase A subunit family amidase
MFGKDSDPECAAIKTVIEKAFKTLGKSGTTFIDVEIPKMTETLTFTQTYTSRSHSDIDSYLATTKLNTTCSQIHAQKAFHPNFDLFASICTSPSIPSKDPNYLQRLEDRETFVMAVVSLMVKNNVSALVFPTAKIPAPLHAVSKRFEVSSYKCACGVYEGRGGRIARGNGDCGIAWEGTDVIGDGLWSGGIDWSEEGTKV